MGALRALHSPLRQHRHNQLFEFGIACWRRNAWTSFNAVFHAHYGRTARVTRLLHSRLPGWTAFVDPRASKPAGASVGLLKPLPAAATATMVHLSAQHQTPESVRQRRLVRNRRTKQLLCSAAPRAASSRTHSYVRAGWRTEDTMRTCGPPHSPGQLPRSVSHRRWRPLRFAQCRLSAR